MNRLDEYSYIWEVDKDKHVLLSDDLGDSILYIKEKEIMFVLIEDDELHNMIISKMLEHGNKLYNSIAELQKDIRANVR